MSSVVSVSSTASTSTGTSSGSAATATSMTRRHLHLHLVPSVEGRDQSWEWKEQGWAVREFEPGNRTPHRLLRVGKKVSLDEFLDRYNHKHIPVRLHHLKSFLFGVQYSASNSCTPSWVALYDIDDTTTFSHELYTGTRLRANRSP
ncbi:hypothetical protein D9758_018969 [Tetrapyrgos nigripes]|uniref:Uncharacterized protein n=1 Tax=Tetrapyrgos nigripes TaxID=182062 RepID=A0A8H5ER05_9AGAR|nr:hypothetical protein D9758_018969 [Tetrapyrgos nigripes]